MSVIVTSYDCTAISERAFCIQNATIEKNRSWRPPYSRRALPIFPIFNHVVRRVHAGDYFCATAFCRSLKIGCGIPIAAGSPFLARPRILAARQPLRHFGLKLRRPIGNPFIVDLKNQWATALRQKSFSQLIALSFGRAPTATATWTGTPRQRKLAGSKIKFALSGRIHSGRGLLSISQPHTNCWHGSTGRSS